MPDTPSEIVLIDDDASLLRAFARQIRTMGYKASPFSDPVEGMRHLASGRGDCLVLDLHMPGMSGLELQDHLNAMPRAVPILFISGQATIPSTVRAIQNGAVDFLEKPFEYSALEEAIGSALGRGEAMKKAQAQRDLMLQRFEALTERQQAVFRILVTGAPNKVIAHQLGISERTVKAHRQAIMIRLEAASIADVYRVATELDGVLPGDIPAKPS